MKKYIVLETEETKDIFTEFIGHELFGEEYTEDMVKLYTSDYKKGFILLYKDEVKEG